MAGELFRVEEEVFERLDALYACRPDDPARGEFVRRQVEVETAAGERTTGWAYFLRAATLRERFGGAEEIPGGDWRAFLAARPTPVLGDDRGSEDL